VSGHEAIVLKEDRITIEWETPEITARGRERKV
jgi:hypothetical protein